MAYGADVAIVAQKTDNKKVFTAEMNAVLGSRFAMA